MFLFIIASSSVWGILDENTMMALDGSWASTVSDIEVT